MSDRLPVVCIVGRTNVGKSTLFNAIVGKRKAVTQDSPGVTRDRCYESVSRWAFPFTLIDTGALVGEENISLHKSVREQSRLAMQESDVIVAVFDGLHGIHPQDEEVVNLIREFDKPVIWVANKCEKENTQYVAQELYGLGIPSLICLTAAHRRGVRDLIAAIAEVLGIVPQSNRDDMAEAEFDVESDELLVTPENQDETVQDDAAPKIVRIAILGKPNVGKSTLVNKLLGEERMITSPIAGTTRDSISSEITRNGQKFELVDTAGLRKKAGVGDGSIERFSNLRTLRSLAASDVAIFLLDAAEGIPTEQDAKIVGIVHDRGKGLVIVVNKWDLIEKDNKTAENYRAAIRSVFKFCAYAPVIFVSALTGQRCPSILDKVLEVYGNSRVRIKTAELNKILEQAFGSKPPPVYHGAPIKLMYATQVGIQPPTMALFLSYPDNLDFAYQRYIKNQIRKHVAFEGCDIKLILKRRSQLEAA